MKIKKVFKINGKIVSETEYEVNDVGLGDAVAGIAYPIAKAIDSVLGTNIQNCGGCKDRQKKLNELFPNR